MKRVIDAGELGEVFHLSFERLGMGRIRRDSNVWWNSAPHDLSILFYLVPRPVKTVQLYLNTYLQRGVADMAVCHLELEGGVTAHVYLSWLHPEKTATVTVVGASACSATRAASRSARSRSSTTRSTRACRRRCRPAGVPIVPITKFEGRKLDVPLGTEPLSAAAEHFVESIAAGREPLTSGARSLRVVEALETADRTAVRTGPLRSAGSRPRASRRRAGAGADRLRTRTRRRAGPCCARG